MISNPRFTNNCTPLILVWCPWLCSQLVQVTASMSRKVYHMQNTSLPVMHPLVLSPKTLFLVLYFSLRNVHQSSHFLLFPKLVMLQFKNFHRQIDTVILIITGIPSPTHSFTLGLNSFFSANPPYPSLSFFSFRSHCTDFPDCLLYFGAYPSFYFLVFLFLHF